jgi:hypothetical protein
LNYKLKDMLLFFLAVVATRESLVDQDQYVFIDTFTWGGYWNNPCTEAQLSGLHSCWSAHT